MNGKGKKNHTYSFTSDWRTSADRDQIEKATYPSPSLPLPLSQLKHRLCWRGHGVPAFQRKQPWGKTSLVLKKTPRKHRLDNNWGKPAFSCTSQMCQNSSACLTSSRIKQEMTPFPRHLFICCAGVDRKVGRTRQSTHLFPIISNKRQKSKLNKPEERAEERIRRLSRDGSSVNFKRQRGEFWGSTNKNDSIINYRRWVLQVQGAERGTVNKTAFSLECFIFGEGWKSIWSRGEKQTKKTPSQSDRETQTQKHKPIFENDLRDHRIHSPSSSGLISINLCSSLFYWTVCEPVKLYNKQTFYGSCILTG